MQLAPIVVFAYKRLHHLKKTIESLKKNILSKDSDLIIFSDGPKNEEEKENITKIRKFIVKIQGFKSIKVYEQERNNGLANSVINGVNKVLLNYDRIIVLEDDIHTSKFFLKFMNESLQVYDNERYVMSISGYKYPLKMPKNYKEDVFLFERPSSWGWGIWKNRWEEIDFNISEKHEIFHNKSLKKKLDSGGKDIYKMLVNYIKGRSDSWAVRYALAHSINNKYALFPKHSLTHNIGNDGSGTHRGVSSFWDAEIKDDFDPKVSIVRYDSSIKWRSNRYEKYIHFLKKFINQ